MNSRFRIKDLRFFVILFILFISIDMSAQNIPCKFDKKTMQFVGTPLEQARCLLRPNKPRGILDKELKRLPKPIEKLIGSKVKFKKEKLRKYLLATSFSSLAMVSLASHKQAPTTLVPIRGVTACGSN